MLCSRIYRSCVPQYSNPFEEGKDNVSEGLFKTGVDNRTQKDLVDAVLIKACHCNYQGVDICFGAGCFPDECGDPRFYFCPREGCYLRYFNVAAVENGYVYYTPQVIVVIPPTVGFGTVRFNDPVS